MKKDYKQIVTAHKNLPVFHQKWWLDAHGLDWDFVVAQKGEFITGVWPFFIEKKYGLKISRNPVLTPYLGPVVFYPHNLSTGKKDTFQHGVVRQLLEQMPVMATQHFACSPGLKQLGLFNEFKLETRFQQTFLIDLKQSESQLLEHMTFNHRKSLEAGLKELTICNEPSQIELLYDYLSHTLHKANKPVAFSKNRLTTLFEASQEHAASALWIARKGDSVQAMAWQVWDETCSYFLASSKNPFEKNNHATTALIWKCIQHSQSLGHQYFDFEGSMVPGIERFFRNFGGQREIYPVLTKTNSSLLKFYQILKGK